MNHELYQSLLKMYEYMCDGRIYLARDILEKILDIDKPPEAA